MIKKNTKSTDHKCLTVSIAKGKDQLLNHKLNDKLFVITSEKDSISMVIISGTLNKNKVKFPLKLAALSKR